MDTAIFVSHAAIFVSHAAIFVSHAAIFVSHAAIFVSHAAIFVSPAAAGADRGDALVRRDDPQGAAVPPPDCHPLRPLLRRVPRAPELAGARRPSSRDGRATTDDVAGTPTTTRRRLVMYLCSIVIYASGWDR